MVLREPFLSLLLAMLCGSAGDAKGLVPAEVASSLFAHSDEGWSLAGASAEQPVHPDVRIGWIELAVEASDKGDKLWYFAAPEAFRGAAPPTFSGDGMLPCGPRTVRCWARMYASIIWARRSFDPSITRQPHVGVQRRALVLAAPRRPPAALHAAPHARAQRCARGSGHHPRGRTRPHPPARVLLRGPRDPLPQLLTAARRPRAGGLRARAVPLWRHRPKPRGSHGLRRASQRDRRLDRFKDRPGLPPPLCLLHAPPRPVAPLLLASPLSAPPPPRADGAARGGGRRRRGSRCSGCSRTSRPSRSAGRSTRPRRRLASGTCASARRRAGSGSARSTLAM